MKKTSLTLALTLLLALSACGLPGITLTEPSAPQPAPVTEIVETTPEPTPAPVVDTPALSVEQLLNTTYTLSDAVGGQFTYPLSDGGYQNMTDPATPGYAAVFILRERIALGDLNGDGASDAIVPIGLNFGGTGQFMHLAAVLNQGGMPVHMPAASYGLGDRPMVNALSIQDGKIHLEAVVSGPNDPACCPSQPITMAFEYNDMGFRLLNMTTTTPTGLVREIVISEPADEAMVGPQATLKGNTTVGPFENTLIYRVYGPDGMAVIEGGFTVQSDGLGAPATFELPLNFAELGVSGRIRVEIAEMSMADGSTLMLDSVYLWVD